MKTTLSILLEYQLKRVMVQDTLQVRVKKSSEHLDSPLW